MKSCLFQSDKCRGSVRSRKGSVKKKSSPALATSCSLKQRRRPEAADGDERRASQTSARKSLPNVLDVAVSTPTKMPPHQPNGGVRAIQIQTEEEKVKEATQIKWECEMGPKYTILVRTNAQWKNAAAKTTNWIFFLALQVASLSKADEKCGLGISLEGTVDVEDGREVRPHHYIRSILPQGPVGTDGRLQSGDELLEVTGGNKLIITASWQ